MRSVASGPFQPHGLQPMEFSRLVCPWNSPGKNTGVGSHFLQGVFPTQGSNPCLLHGQAGSSLLCHLGSLGGNRPDINLI